jgi:hypothetical protein
MIGLQEMLLQTPGRKILVAPAWPSDWDCDFKLHAPYRTVVQGSIRDGKVVSVHVTPASRRQDMEIVGPPALPPVPVSQGKPAAASSVYHKPGYEPDKAFDGDPTTRWSMDSGQGTGWLEVDLGKPTAVSRVVIQEQSYPQTTRFAVEAQKADGSWKTLAEGGAIGAFKELNITPTTSRKFRVRIIASALLNAGAGVTIDECELFE